MDCYTPTVLSLCTGAGGLELGIKLALPDVRTICYVEGEAYAAAQLASRMEDETLDAAPVWSDVKTFDPEPWCGCVDIVTAGYPCQPFSIAGTKRGENDPRHLWPHIRDIVCKIEPRVCLFENVAHHLRLGFEQVHDDLRKMGYGVKAALFTAEEVGAPHKRERLFILAHTKNARAWINQSLTRQRPVRNSQGLAYTFEPGLERYTRHAVTNDSPDVTGDGSLQPWPPGPNELSKWNGIPDALKPAVHRMAHGMAYRVDRLRLCGNGVVPLVAAYAFETLIASIDPET